MQWDKWGGKTSFYGVWRQQERLKPRSENLLVWLNILLEIGFKDLAAFAQQICGKAQLPPRVSIQKKTVEVSQCSLPLQSTNVLDILLPHLATASSHHLLETCETCSLSSNTLVIFPSWGIAEKGEANREILLLLAHISYLLLSPA